MWVNDLEMYLPIDRRVALASRAIVPELTHGAVMFADVTGFTPLAESLVQALGSRRGAEELTALLNQVYSALIAEIEQFGGSVIGFSGDAITCWFDDEVQIVDWRLQIGESADLQSAVSNLQSGALRAVAAALAMQRAMTAFAAIPTPSGATAQLMVKVAIAAGPIRRFLIGDPQIQVLEVLAGRTLDRLAAAAHLAERDDVVIDMATLDQIEPSLPIASWRIEAETQQRAAVIAELPIAVTQAPWPAILADRLSDGELRPWVLPAVYARLRHSADPFLAELRPVVALMVQFGGLNYDTDASAGARLDAYIRRVQAIVTRYEGHVVDVTMADKGGYLFAAFGALYAHEDDARRAGLAALELRTLRVTPQSEAARIGISRGMMRTGPYGGATRRAYGVLGDDVNLACRLMSAAAPGQILASAHARQAMTGTLEWAALPPIRLKGKRAPVAMYQLLAEAPAHPATPKQAARRTRLIGRDAERTVLNDVLSGLLQGMSGIVIIDGEPGIGKSRLIAELAEQLQQRGVAALSAGGQSIEGTSYSAWRAIFGSRFGLDREPSSVERQVRLHKEIAVLVPALLDRLPLLNDVFNLGMDDTDFTRSLDPAERGEHTANLLVELLRAQASKQPLAIVLDDAHLLDSRSLAVVVRAAQVCMTSGDPSQLACPMLIVLGLRPVGADHPAMVPISRLLGLRGARRITLGALAAHETAGLTAARLGVHLADLPREVAELVQARAGGNPLFAEELIQTLRDDGAIQIETILEDDQQRARCVARDDLRHASQKLPDTLQGLILGRIDRLPPAERLTLRIASVIGPTFEYQLLHSIRDRQVAIDKPALKNQLRELAAQDFTWLEEPEPHLAYRFKHILTQEAAYQSLLYAQRREIHELIADWYEQTYGNPQFSAFSSELEQVTDQNSRLAPYIALLAYHYRMAEDAERERLYIALAGEQEINASAFQEAIACFERAMALTPPDSSAARSRLAAQLGRTYMFLGDFGAAERRYQESMALAAAAGERPAQARACFELAALAYRRRLYPAALELLERGLGLYRAASHRRGEARVLDRMGGIYIELGEETKALECYQQALALGRSGRDRRRG